MPDIPKSVSKYMSEMAKKANAINEKIISESVQSKRLTKPICHFVVDLAEVGADDGTQRS